MKKSRYIIGALMIATLAWTGCEKKQPVVQDIPVVKLSSVQNLDGSQGYSYSGQVEASTQSNVSFKVGGNITNIFVKQGDYVKQGTILATIDPSDYQLQLQSAQANLDQAKAQAQNAKSTLIRSQQLYAQGDTSAAVLDNATAQYQYAQNEVVSVEKKIGVLKNQVNYTQLVAPFTGTVSLQLVDAGTNVAAGTPIFVMTSSNTSYQLVVGVPVATMQNIAMGQTVQIQNGSENFSGTISSISNVPTGVGNTYQVKINLNRPPQDIVIGMTLNAIFNVSTSSVAGGVNGVLVPTNALTKYNGNSGVFVAQTMSGATTMKLQFVPVTVVKAVDSGVIVQGALTIGSKVVSAGTYSMNDGEIVSPLSQED